MKYTLAELNALPTLSVGQDADLKIETNTRRVWLFRMTKADGMPYDNQVTIEQAKVYHSGGVRRRMEWVTVKQYEAK